MDDVHKKIHKTDSKFKIWSPNHQNPGSWIQNQNIRCLYKEPVHLFFTSHLKTIPETHSIKENSWGFS